MPREIDEEVKKLLAIYFDNFAGSIPSTAESATFHLKAVLKETIYENIEPLVMIVAKTGMVLTRNSLATALNKKNAPPPKPTPSPPAYKEPDYSGAVPMPEGTRDLFFKIREENRRS